MQNILRKVIKIIHDVCNVLLWCQKSKPGLDLTRSIDFAVSFHNAYCFVQLEPHHTFCSLMLI